MKNLETPTLERYLPWASRGSQKLVYDSPLDQLIHSAYEAPLRPGGWEGLVKMVRRLMGAEGVLLGVVKPGGSSVTCTAGYDAVFMETYLADFAASDPWLPEAAIRPEGNTAPSTDLSSNEEFRRTDFYNDFLRGYGLLEGFGGKIALDADGHFAAISGLTGRMTGSGSRPDLTPTSFRSW